MELAVIWNTLPEEIGQIIRNIAITIERFMVSPNAVGLRRYLLCPLDSCPLPGRRSTYTVHIPPQCAARGSSDAGHNSSTTITQPAARCNKRTKLIRQIQRRKQNEKRRNRICVSSGSHCLALLLCHRLMLSGCRSPTGEPDESRAEFRSQRAEAECCQDRILSRNHHQ